MTYILSDEQYENLRDYFELAMTAMSDDEQAELIFKELPLRDMLRQLRPASNDELRPSGGVSSPE